LSITKKIEEKYKIKESYIPPVSFLCVEGTEAVE